MTDGSETQLAQHWALASTEALDRLSELARRSLGAEFALVSTFTSTLQLIKGRAGNRAPRGAGDTIALPQSFCRYVIETNGPLLANRVDAHHSLRTIPQVGIAEPIKAYLGVPVRKTNGQAMGTLCVCDTRERDWTEDDLALLGDLATVAVSRIELKLESQARTRAESALRASQARLLVVANYIPGLVYERRKTGPTTSHYTIFGDSKRKLPGVMDLMDDSGKLAFVHPDDRARVADAIQRSTLTETDLDLTFRALTPRGRTRWLRSQSVVRHDDDGTAVWDGLCFDITDLETAREAAEIARAAKDTLLIDVNHELRTPLQAIVGYTEFLQTETRPEVVRTHALTIQNAGKSLLSIVNQLLDLASSEDGTTSVLNRTATNVKLLAEMVHSMVAPLALEKGLTSRLIVDPDVPPMALADGPKLQQVIVNLLNNAIKFTNEGAVTLHVSLRATRLRFSVSDTGIGIAEDKLEFLFQRFSRIEPERRAIRGTGLGLAIAKQLVERMNGTIAVEANAEGGMTFWFEVAAEPCAAVAFEPVAGSPERETRATTSHILVADDLDLNRKLIADMLSLDGHEVDCVTDGAEALRAARENHYDLILMDMIMPVMDGIAATRAIRALPAPFCDVPIIALTAHSFKEQLDSCLSAGMDATLTKPMSLDALSSTVRSWTRDRSKAA